MRVLEIIDTREIARIAGRDNNELFTPYVENYARSPEVADPLFLTKKITWGGAFPFFYFGTSSLYIDGTFQQCKDYRVPGL